jgi:hypothetical protein
MSFNDCVRRRQLEWKGVVEYFFKKNLTETNVRAILFGYEKGGTDKADDS